MRLIGFISIIAGTTLFTTGIFMLGMWFGNFLTKKEIKRKLDSIEWDKILYYAMHHKGTPWIKHTVKHSINLKNRSRETKTRYRYLDNVIKSLMIIRLDYMKGE